MLYQPMIPSAVTSPTEVITNPNLENGFREPTRTWFGLLDWKLNIKFKHCNVTWKSTCDVLNFEHFILVCPWHKQTKETLVASKRIGHKIFVRISHYMWARNSPLWCMIVSTCPLSSDNTARKMVDARNPHIVFLQI